MAFLVNINKNIRNVSAGHNGLLKDVNGVNGLPVSIAPGFPDLQNEYNQMGIQYVRMHDNLGVGDIDNYCQLDQSDSQNQLIPNIPTDKQKNGEEFVAEFVNKRTIFPFAAAGMRCNDVNLALKNANYAITDSYLKRTLDNDPSVNPNNIQRDILFRIGRTLDCGREVPQNFDIFATLVGELVKRYSSNYYTTGLPRKVTHWEVWSEPYLTFTWNNNTPSVFYDFYSKVARMIKSIDPEAKVGTNGTTNGTLTGGG